MFIVLFMWVLELTLAWALVFIPPAFESPAEVTFEDRFNFAAHTIIGRSNNSPQLKLGAGGWETLSAFAGLTGVALVSLGLAYVLPLIGAIAHKRSTAAMVHALGDSVDFMRATIREAEEGGSFELQLLALTPAIILTAERQRSYPVLHYFHSANRHAALAPAMAKLALLLRKEIPAAPKIDITVTRPIFRAIHNLLGALEDGGLASYARDDPTIDNDALDAIGIGPLDRWEADQPPSIEWLKAYVQFDGWPWEDLLQGDEGDIAEVREQLDDEIDG